MTENETKNIKHGIVIKARREVNSAAVRGYKVVHLKAFMKDRLPDKYLMDGKNSFYYHEGSRSFVLPYDHSRILEVGVFYENDLFHAKVDFIRACGDRLMQVNKEIAKLRESWNGCFDLVI